LIPPAQGEIYWPGKGQHELTAHERNFKKISREGDWVGLGVQTHYLSPGTAAK